MMLSFPGFLFHSRLLQRLAIRISADLQRFRGQNGFIFAEGQLHDKAASLFRLALHPDAAIMEFNKFLRNREPDAASLIYEGTRHFLLEEPLKNLLLFFGRNADA